MGMRLKRLETYGFKSFADRLTFDFEDGITAVVGPNGCGKSNVVDSIKWVVGEQSAKALRGASMDDVIFNGCATRRPMPLAEATLILDVDGIDAGEVAITRRLTRDGQSSYYLNGKPSRLKDIKDFLLDTGIGNNAYSVIEQGRIGFILEASVKDRRGLIEEAAGIAKYKIRRKAASRRLDKVGVDLERIGQVLGEVRKRLRTVARQAETALRYQELAERLRDLRMVFALEEFGRLSGERADLERRIAALVDDEAGIAGRLGELESQLSSADAELLELDDRLGAQEQERSEVRSRRDVAASQLQDARNRLVEIDDQEADDQQALAQLAERLERIAGEIEQTETTLDRADTDADTELTQLYRARREELDQLLAAIDEILGRIEAHKSQEVEVLREISTIEAKLGSLQSTRTGLTDRQTRIDERASGHDSSLAQAREDEAQANAAVAAADAEAQAAHSRLDELIREREEAQAASEQAAGEVNNQRHEYNRIEVRLNLLREYERNQEGIFRGVKDVIKAMNRLPGICGIVADCFEIDKKLELAIETALGGRAQNIITETQSAAKEAIDFLKRERRGRATFLPLDGMRGRSADIRDCAKEPGVIGLASQLIRFDKRYQPVFDNLLGGTLICETLDHALAVKRKHRLNLHLVTLDGEHVAPGGAMTGGRQKGQEHGGIVSRKNEIRRLNEQLQELDQRRTELQTTAESAQRRAFELAMAVTEQNRTIQASERSLGERKAQLMKAERDRNHIEEFSANFAAERNEIELELQRVDADRAEFEQQHQSFNQRRQELEQTIAESQTILHERGEERDRLQEEVSNLRVNLATTEERREALRNHLGHLRRQRGEITDQQEQRQRRLEGHGRRRAELRQAIAEHDQIHQTQAARFEELSVAVTDLAKRRDELRSSQEGERQEARRLEQRRRSLDHERSTHELKANEIGVRLESLDQRIQEDYEIALAEAYQHYERPADLHLPELRRELSQAEQEIARIGPVNLGAIDELKEVEAREQFLGEQFDDLTEAREKLTTIIDQINITSRRLFKRTFKEIRRNFQELFRKLYGGGKADLLLQIDPETDDILEAGLDIMAQPPGKQPKSISLLSGGEKALTAIALLFAVYQTKPSPFCILDEVDAPLDESNTDVYCTMLREFCTKSQFIVITHNKRTMQYADSIYGITQQERGISTKISVKLDDVTSDGQLHETVLGQGPFAN